MYFGQIYDLSIGKRKCQHNPSYPLNHQAYPNTFLVVSMH